MRITMMAVLLLAGCGDPRTTYERKADDAAVATIAAAAPSPAEAEYIAEAKRQSRIDAIHHADPALNWISIGISTSKFSERMNSSVHKTFDECVKHSWIEANECVPIAALPDSYWDAAALD